MKPEDLLATAERLSRSTRPGAPREADLRRARSTIHYALFHTICRSAADFLVGQKGRREPREGEHDAWSQAYRSVEHGRAKAACETKDVIRAFPEELQDFAQEFAQAQSKRHSADYDPRTRDAYRRSGVLSDIQRVRSVMDKFQSANAEDRRAFVAWLTLKHRK